MRIDSTIVAVVTGGASGLGEATARALAAAGARVAVLDLDRARGEVVAREIGGTFCEVDVSSDESVAAGFANVRKELGAERILINCAGIGGAQKTVTRDKATGAARPHPMALFTRILNVNLAGTFRCIAHSAAGMAALEPVDSSGERGVIVNTASVAASDGQIGQAAYAASKSGIVGLTLPVARDLMSEGIRVNTIMPGIFMTPMLAQLPEAVLASLAASVPFPKRLGDPAEFAALAMCLISNGYVNGESIRLDGGIRMAPR